MAVSVQGIDPDRRYTADEFYFLPEHPEGGRYELIDGELFATTPPTYRHQTVVRRIARALDRYCAAHGFPDAVVVPPCEVILDSATIVEPDLFVRALPGMGIEPAAVDASENVALAIEVLSPSTESYDCESKRAAYQRAGIPTVWAIDPEFGAVNVWTGSQETPICVDDLLRWHVHPEAAKFSIPIYELFDNLPK